MFEFNSISEIHEKLSEQKYISTTDIDYAIFCATKLQLPILIEGNAGVGKTELAKVLSNIFNAELLRVQCYEGIDFSKVLYDYNYSKQLLYTNLLKDSLSNMLDGKSFKDSLKIINEKTDFYGEEFLIERPLLYAISPENKNRKVLLIDEIDKADAEFESFLLEILSDFSISIPEYKTIAADENNKPLVILTSNNFRELSDALKRRCIYLYIDFPDEKTIAEIIQTKVNVDYDFAMNVAGYITKVRQLDLKQKPSIAECVTWTDVLVNHLNLDKFSNENKETINNSLSVILKNKNDIKKVKTNFNYTI